VNLTHVKVTEKVVEISWTTHQGEGNATVIEHSCKSTEAGRPELLLAMRSFLAPTLKLLGLTDKYGEDAYPSSVSIKHDDKRGRAIIVTIVKPLAKVNSPFVINSPLLHEGTGEEAPGSMPKELVECLATLTKEAVHYINGERAQLDVLKEPAPPARPGGTLSPTAQAVADAAPSGSSKPRLMHHRVKKGNPKA
jgi:hypothetical protein